MDVVVINRSTRKAGLMLALLGLIVLYPLLLYIQNPVEFSPNFNSWSYLQIAFCVFVLGLTVIATVYFLKALLSKTVALEISEEGIRYNPTGCSEQFMPVEDLYGATLERTGNGSFSALLVLKKEGRAEYLNSPVSARMLKMAPGMRIWHEFLDGSPETIAHAINQFFDLSKTAEQPEIYEPNDARNAYRPIIVGVALIVFGFVIPFASVPLWVGLSAALLVITLGSIILSVSPDKLNASDLPKHITKVTKLGVKTLFSGYGMGIGRKP